MGQEGGLHGIGRDLAVGGGQGQDLVAAGLDGAGLVDGDMAGIGAEHALEGLQEAVQDSGIRLRAACQEIDVGIRSAGRLADEGAGVLAEAVVAVTLCSLVVGLEQVPQHRFLSTVVIVAFEMEHRV